MFSPAAMLEALPRGFTIVRVQHDSSKDRVLLDESGAIPTWQKNVDNEDI